jgi:hypothetical protein
MATLETRKYKIISQITALNNESAIQELESLIKKISFELYHSNIIKPIQSNQSVESMISDQKYKGMDRKYLDKLVQEMDIKEPIGELIALI